MKLWDVDSDDTKGGATVNSVETALQNGITNKISDGKTKLTVLFHDHQAFTANNLDGFLQKIEETVEDAGHVVGFELL